MTQNNLATEIRSREFVAFRIGTQEFCIDIMSVREIRGWTPATPLPRAPHFVRGVINLRGAVLPVVDLAQRLELAAVQQTATQVIIVAQIGSRIVGLLVDAVSDILNIESGKIQPTPDVSSEVARSFVTGIIGIEDRMISLLSLDHILPNGQAEIV
jgi:purine-binding chemotaxis protein CheW